MKTGMSLRSICNFAYLLIAGRAFFLHIFKLILFVQYFHFQPFVQPFAGPLLALRFKTCQPMKNISLLCCLLFATSLLAQNTTTWFPPGAKWKYEYQSLSGPGREVLELVGNEVFAGHLCAKVHQYGYHEGWPTGPTDHGYHYFYAQNDSVFRWQNDHFQLLYDFTRQTGDTIVLADGLYEQGVIDSTGMTTFFNIPVRFQDISLISSHLPDTLHTRVYARLGGQHLIYWDIESPLTEIQYYLSCYRDEEYPEYTCNLLDDFTYHPFPENNATWSEEDASFCGFYGYQYKMEGDTVIPGLGQGKKLYARNTYQGNIGCPTPVNLNLQEPYQLQGILNQSVSEKKVFFTRLTENPILPICVTTFGNDYFPLGQPVTLYDFDLEVGDVISNDSTIFPYTVLAIDSVQLKDGTWRRAFYFDEQGYYFWIEGIGSSLGLFNSHIMPATDISCTLNCFSENNQLQYPKSLADNAFCDSILVATSNPNDLSNQIKLYPNPASQAFTLEVPADAVPALARLFDAQGRELSRQEITETIYHWTIPALDISKVLFLQLQTADKRTGGRVLRVE